jgi:hypothetical protein
MEITKRIGARVGLAAVGAGVVIALSPLAAQASVVTWSGGLGSGTEQCVGAYAGSDARAVGAANPPGVVFRVSRNGAELFRTPARVNTVDRYLFGPGFYQFCAKNAAGLGQPVTGVNLGLLTDADA